MYPQHTTTSKGFNRLPVIITSLINPQSLEKYSIHCQDVLYNLVIKLEIHNTCTQRNGISKATTKSDLTYCLMMYTWSIPTHIHTHTNLMALMISWLRTSSSVQ